MREQSFPPPLVQQPCDNIPLPSGEMFAVTPAPEAARFILRGDPAFVTAFGVDPPMRLCASVRGGRAALWLGPDEFLIMAQGEDPDEPQRSMEAALADQPHSLVDISHRQVGLVIEGPLAARCLSAGCPLDLRLSAYPVGMAVRTMFLKTEIVLWRQGEQRFHIEIWRSFAAYLVAHLAEARAGVP